MSSLENSIKLYKLMRDRCAASGFCEHQAKVYAEMVDFIAACDSVEDSMQKIKNSKYYLAPSAALLKDKLEAEKKFATHHDMQDLADVYDAKIREIDEDVNNMYTNDYSSKAQTIKSNYVNSLTAFGNVFVAYVTYLCSGEDTHITDIKKQAGYIKYPASDFAEVAKLEIYQNLVPLNVDAYNKFVSDVCEILNGGNVESFADIANEDAFDVEAEFDTLSSKKEELKAKGEKWLSLSFENSHIAHAPTYDASKDISNLKYEYEG